MSRPRAAVDSGTNSTRLLVVDAEGRDVVRVARITRLGRAVDATGRLDPEALERTLAVLAEYRDAWVRAGVVPGDVVIAATSAVRDATNRERWFAGVRDLTGVDPVVLSGDEEARLSYTGAVGQVDVPAPTMVVDVGGGSTELIVGSGDEVAAAHSLQVGAVRVTERHLPSDPPTAEEVHAARRMVDEAVGVAVERLHAAGAALAGVRSLVGVAGTVATLAALHAGARSADDPGLHGHRIPAAHVADLAGRLAAMTTAQRAALPGVPEGRADVLAAGALVLDAVVARVGVPEVVVSLADVLDGLVVTLADPSGRVRDLDASG